jgi:hypothetical protein
VAFFSDDCRFLDNEQLLLLLWASSVRKKKSHCVDDLSTPLVDGACEPTVRPSYERSRPTRASFGNEIHTRDTMLQQEQQARLILGVQSGSILNFFRESN